MHLLLKFKITSLFPTVIALHMVKVTEVAEGQFVSLLKFYVCYSEKQKHVWKS